MRSSSRPDSTPTTSTARWPGRRILGGIIKAGLGPGTSPIIYKNLIILQCDQEMGDGSFIVALECKTGEEVWRATRTNRRSWATPLVVNAGDARRADRVGRRDA